MELEQITIEKSKNQRVLGVFEEAGKHVIVFEGDDYLVIDKLSGDFPITDEMKKKHNLRYEWKIYNKRHEIIGVVPVIGAHIDIINHVKENFIPDKYTLECVFLLNETVIQTIYTTD